MTLHEAVSVFLIIGGALLGPVEGTVTWLSNGQCACDLGDRPGPLCPVKEELDGSQCHPLYETTAETCARALREIGADENGMIWLSSGRCSCDLGDRPGPLCPIKSELDGSQCHSQRVLCIPAPTGLKQ